MLLLVLAACLRPVDPPTLGVPVAPIGGSIGPSMFGISVRLPKGADAARPWTASDPRVTCEAAGELLDVQLRVPSAAEWPYQLPAAVTCTQDDVSIMVPVAFTAPAPHAWTASDGTLVFPRRTNTYQSGCDALPDLTDARLEPAAPGVSCRVAGGALCVDLTPEAAAGEHVCAVTRADGTVEARRVVIVAY